MANPHFYPPVEPFATGTLAVDAPHVLYWEQVGRPDGIPILFVHGGPGAGCSEFDRRFFDPERFRVVLVDQRGAGRSRPHGELSANGPDQLVADFEAIRGELGIDRWHLFGGSWGSTLALHYAEEHPERVSSMVLRGIWLMRDEDIHWWLYDLGKIQPELWAAFAGLVSEGERGDLLEAYWRRLTGDDREAALGAARAWSVYEGSACTLLPNEEFAGMFEDPDMAWSLARLEAHYTRNVRLRPDTLLLDRVDRIRHIPAIAVHGRYDIICPAKNLHDLRTAWPELDAVIVPDAGHSSHEPGITRELVAATRRIAETGSPVRQPRTLYAIACLRLVTPQELITTAKALAKPFRPSSDVEVASVAAALISGSGRLYTGVCIDAGCGIGFCAEHAAVAEMLKNRESEVSYVVALDQAGEVLPPCGRCRELLWQIDSRNDQTKVVLSATQVVPLIELLPERGERG